MLVILTTHPIQYQVPLWRALAESGDVPFEVWYLSDHGARQAYDAEFGKAFAWDFEMLEGYPHRFLSRDPRVRVDQFWSAGLPEGFGKLLDEQDVSAIWIQGWQVRAYWQAVAAAHRRSIPVWLRGESNDLGQVPLLKGLAKRAALSWLFRRVNWFLTIGTANARLYARFGVGAKQMRPAPYCIDNVRFAEQARALRPRRAELRRQWGIPEDAFCPLFVGKFIPKKRPLDLLFAAQGMGGRVEGRPLHPLFVGSGALDAELRAACRAVFDADRGGLVPEQDRGPSGLPPASFAGFLNQTEISAAYVAADCLVLPSNTAETWGLVVNEAMASGLPCVVSAACGCAEDLVSPLRTEAVFQLGDIEGLIRALRQAANDPLPPERLWAQVERFKPQISIESVTDIYQHADHGSRPPALSQSIRGGGT